MRKKRDDEIELIKNLMKEISEIYRWIKEERETRPKKYYQSPYVLNKREYEN
jgi:hypothetical protein